MGAVPLIHRIPVPIRQFLGFFPAIKAGHELRLVMDAIVTCGRRITDYRKLALREGYMGATNPIARDDFMSTLSGSIPLFSCICVVSRRSNSKS